MCEEIVSVYTSCMLSPGCGWCVQIQHAAKINEIESVEDIRKAEAHMKQYFHTRKKWVGWVGMTEGGAGGWNRGAKLMTLLAFQQFP